MGRLDNSSILCGTNNAHQYLLQQQSAPTYSRAADVGGVDAATCQLFEVIRHGGKDPTNTVDSLPHIKTSERYIRK